MQSPARAIMIRDTSTIPKPETYWWVVRPFWFGIVMSRASPVREKLNLDPRECAIDNTSINLGANAILPQFAEIPNRAQ